MTKHLRNKKIFFAIFGTISILIIIAVAGLGVLSMYGGIGVLQTSETSQQTKADEFATAVADTAKGGVVFLGDSITEMYDLDKFYPEKKYINRGISSNETAQVLARLKTNVIDIAPSTVVFLIGVNDIGHDITEKAMMDNFTKVCTAIGEMTTPPKLLVQSIYPTNNLSNFNSYLATKARTNKKITSANVLISAEVKRLAASGQNVKYINTHSVLVDDNGNLNSKFTFDGLHINRAGYTVITEYLAPFI